MKLTIKAIYAHIEHDYTMEDAKKIHKMIRDGYGPGLIYKHFPHLGYGIEYIELEHKDGSTKTLAYINAGDTYASTFMRNMNGNIVISTVGDLVENLPSTWRAL